MAGKGHTSAARSERQARVERMRAEQRARDRRQRLLIIGGGGLLAVVLLAVVIILGVAGKGGSSSKHEVLPSSVGTGLPRIEAAALVVRDTSGIPGVVSYDTTGWPQGSSNGPAAQALPHDHVDGPVRYSVTPPVGGDHNAVWMNCGIYDKAVPSERAVHNLEHGAVWITYQPNLSQATINALRAFVLKQSDVVLNLGGQRTDLHSKFMDLTPFPGLSAPIVLSSWGHQLKVTSPDDPRMQRFVNAFRTSSTQSPEYGSACTGGLGTPVAS